MSLKQFEVALRKSRGQIFWHPKRHRWNTGIRGHLPHGPNHALTECCPITAVAYALTGQRWSLDEVELAAAEIGLSVQDQARIIAAADGALDAPAISLWDRLRTCVGLPPEEHLHA